MNTGVSQFSVSMPNLKATNVGDPTFCGDRQTSYVDVNNGQLSYVNVSESVGQPTFTLDVSDPDVETMSGNTIETYTVTSFLTAYPGVTLTYNAVVTYTCPDLESYTVTA